MQRRGSSEDPAIFDTSSLIFLDLLGYIPLLRMLYKVVLPKAVSEELSARPNLPGSMVASLDWISSRVPDTELVRQVGSEPPAIGRGETEVVALGLELSCLVVLDDRKAPSMPVGQAWRSRAPWASCSGCITSASPHGT